MRPVYCVYGKNTPGEHHCDNEKNSTPRNKRTNITADAGPSKVATSKYSPENINETDLSTMLNDFWQTAANHQGPGKIDHVWFDSDR